MAKSKSDISETELPLAPPSGPVFKNPDSSAPTGPVNKGAAVPQDETVVPGRMPGAALPQEVQHDPTYIAAPRQNVSMAQLVTDFLTAVAAHPDGAILSSAIGGAPNDQQAQIFPNVPRRNQHVSEIRVIYCDSVRQEIAGQPQEREWKYAHLFKKQVPAPEAPPAQPRRETVMA